MTESRIITEHVLNALAAGEDAPGSQRLLERTGLAWTDLIAIADRFHHPRHRAPGRPLEPRPWTKQERAEAIRLDGVNCSCALIALRLDRPRSGVSYVLLESRGGARVYKRTGRPAGRPPYDPTKPPKRLTVPTCALLREQMEWHQALIADRARIAARHLTRGRV